MKTKKLVNVLMLIICILIGMTSLSFAEPYENGFDKTTYLTIGESKVGYEAINISGCKTWSMSPDAIDRAAAIGGCQQALSGLGIGGNFQCRTCSGDWTYKGGSFKSQNGIITNEILRMDDGYEVNLSPSILSVSHPSSNYKIVYRIDGLKSLAGPYVKGSTKYTIIEAILPNSISQTIQRLNNSNGYNENINTTYKIIDHRWQFLADETQFKSENYGNNDAVHFAMRVMGDPDYTERVIINYFNNYAKK